MKNCAICKNIIQKRVSDSQKKYQTRVVCSRICYREWVKLPDVRKMLGVTNIGNTRSRGRKYTQVQKDHLRSRLIGRKFSAEAHKNISLGHMGNKAYNWKGGISPITELIRSTSQYKEWRKEVLKKDRFCCQMCGVVGCKLQADHIKPFSSIVNDIKNVFGIEKLREYAKQSVALWDVSNGRTMCKECHEKTPSYIRGAIKNTSTLSNMFYLIK